MFGKAIPPLLVGHCNVVHIILGLLPFQVNLGIRLSHSLNCLDGISMGSDWNKYREPRQDVHFDCFNSTTKI